MAVTQFDLDMRWQPHSPTWYGSWKWWRWRFLLSAIFGDDVKHSADGDGVDGLCCEPTYAGWPPCIDDLLFIFFSPRTRFVVGFFCHSSSLLFRFNFNWWWLSTCVRFTQFNGCIEVLISHTIMLRFELNLSVVATFRFKPSASAPVHERIKIKSFRLAAHSLGNRYRSREPFNLGAMLWSTNSSTRHDTSGALDYKFAV